MICDGIRSSSVPSSSQHASTSPRRGRGEQVEARADETHLVLVHPARVHLPRPPVPEAHLNTRRATDARAHARPRARPADLVARLRLVLAHASGGAEPSRVPNARAAELEVGEPEHPGVELLVLGRAGAEAHPQRLDRRPERAGRLLDRRGGRTRRRRREVQRVGECAVRPARECAQVERRALARRRARARARGRWRWRRRRAPALAARAAAAQRRRALSLTVAVEDV